MKVLAAALVVGGASSASLLPPALARVDAPGLVVADEDDRRQELRSLAHGSPTLLLPIFTRCGGTCPVTAMSLKEALATAGSRFRVIVFSFDGEDTAKDLRSFRARLGLPAAWLLARSVEGAATRAFFDRLDFHFMAADGGFDHPNETFVLSPEGVWAATFAGSSFRKEELEAAFGRALAADDPAAPRRLGSWLMRPEAWIAIACSGFALSLLAIFWFAKARRSIR